MGKNRSFRRSGAAQDAYCSRQAAMGKPDGFQASSSKPAYTTPVEPTPWGVPAPVDNTPDFMRKYNLGQMAIAQLNNLLVLIRRELNAAKAAFKPYDDVVRLDRGKEMVKKAISARDQTRSWPLEDLLCYDQEYGKLTPEAAREDDAAPGSEERILVIPFHANNPEQLAKTKVTQSCALASALALPELREKIIRHLPFESRKALAISCKEMLHLTSTVFEVWDTNAARYNGYDEKVQQVGWNTSGRPSTLDTSMSMFFQPPRSLFREMQERISRAKFGTVDGQPRVTLNSSDPMIHLYEENIHLQAKPKPTGDGFKCVTLTAVRFEATEETKGRAPRLAYFRAFEAQMRGFEALINVGHSLTSLEISAQQLLDIKGVKLLIAVLPHLGLLTLRNNILLDASHLEPLMEVVHDNVPTCTLDFHPYFFAGPPKEPKKEAEDEEAQCQPNKKNPERVGIFGLSWQDCGLHTPLVVASWIHNIKIWEKKYDLDVLSKGMGVRAFLKRLPLPVGFVEKILRSHEILEQHRGKASFATQELRHHQRVFHLARFVRQVRSFRSNRHDDTSSQDYPAIAQCETCKVDSDKRLHKDGKCYWCKMVFYLEHEWHFYRHEKRDVLGKLFWDDEANEPIRHLSQVFGAPAPPKPKEDKEEDNTTEQQQTDGEGGNNNNNENSDNPATAEANDANAAATDENSTASAANDDSAAAQDSSSSSDSSGDTAASAAATELTNPSCDPDDDGNDADPVYDDALDLDRPFAVAAYKRYTTAFLSFAELHFTRQWDVLRLSDPGLCRFSPTIANTLGLRSDEPWSDRGPGDHEFFEYQNAYHMDEAWVRFWVAKDHPFVPHDLPQPGGEVKPYRCPVHWAMWEAEYVQKGDFVAAADLERTRVLLHEYKDEEERKHLLQWNAVRPRTRN